MHASKGSAGRAREENLAEARVVVRRGIPVRDDRDVALHEGMERFPAEIFGFDPRLRDGWLSDRYFVRTAATLAHAGRDPEVVMQVFAKKRGVLAGVYEALRLLETQVSEGYAPGDLVADSLVEGDEIAPRETVLLICGPYRAFAHLETPLLGVLARRTMVATNTRAAVEAAGGKPVIFMAARHDDWRVQVADGYAARVGGAGQVSSDAGGSWWGAEGVGTMPHAMIAAFHGDTVEATLAFARYARDFEPGLRIFSLVDYHNKVVDTSLAVARAMEREFGPGALAAVRIDTSETLIDRSLIEDPQVWGRESLTGVNAPLVRKLRAALDRECFPGVGILVSGGFTPAKIRRFEAEGVPVTGYGVGSSLLGHNDGDQGLLTSFDFTADLVRVDGDPHHKVGRPLLPNPRLVRVDWGRAGARADR
jgi:nicotinate phosphoribosyltransferase